jgi:glucose uptake protein GlcU
MVAMLPISINGIGLAEGSFAYLISKFGVSYETGIIVMILSRVLAVLISLLGGIFYFKDKPSPRVAES